MPEFLYDKAKPLWVTPRNWDDIKSDYDAEGEGGRTVLEVMELVYPVREEDIGEQWWKGTVDEARQLSTEVPRQATPDAPRQAIADAPRQPNADATRADTVRPEARSGAVGAPRKRKRTQKSAAVVPDDEDEPEDVAESSAAGAKRARSKSSVSNP